MEGHEGVKWNWDLFFFSPGVIGFGSLGLGITNKDKGTGQVLIWANNRLGNGIQPKCGLGNRIGHFTVVHSVTWPFECKQGGSTLL